MRWGKLESADALADWEAAWARQLGAPARGRWPRIFRPALLADGDVVVVAAYRDGRIVAGAIGNRGADVVGVSNVFVPPHDVEWFGAGCVTEIRDAFPGLPVVGYETGEGLARARRLGFETVGPLRVWARGLEATGS